MAQDETNTEPLDSPHWSLEVWAARCSVYFLAQGGILLLAYAYYGFATDPHHFALGFRVDPIQAGLRFAWGLVGTFIGFFRPRYATAFVLAGAAFFTVLAILGTLNSHALAMTFDAKTNLFNWCVALLATAAGAYALGRAPSIALMFAAHCGAGTSSVSGLSLGLMRTTNSLTGASLRFIPRWTTFGAT